MRWSVTLSRVSIGIAAVALLASACAPAAAPATASPSPTAAAPAPAPRPSPVVTPGLAVATPRPAAAAPTPAPAATPVVAREQARYGGAIAAYASSDAATIDLHQDTSMRTQEKMDSVYNKLVMWDQLRLPEHIAVGDLAETWTTSKDGLEWTFKLRPGPVRWHDGKPLTAEDVRFSLDRVRNPPEGIKKPLVSLYQRIADVKAPDDKTVVIKLRQPTPWFVDLLVNPVSAVLPKHVLEKNQKALEGAAVGSGPFRLKTWTRGVGFDLVKNADYFKPGLPYLDSIKWFQIPDAGTQFAAFRTGRVNYTGPGVRGLSPSEERILRKEMPGVQLHHYTAETRFDIILNTQREPFNDVRVRQAVMMVVDQQKVIDLAYEGLGFKGWYARDEWSLPEKELLALPSVRGVTDADVAKAKALLAQAGVREGVAVGFNQGQFPQYEEQQLAVSAQLRLLGFQPKVRVQVYPTELFASIRKGDFQIIHVGNIYPMSDPDAIFEGYLSNTPTYLSGLKDKQIDDLYEKQSRVLDPVERKKVVDNLQRRLTEMAPSVPLLWPRYILGAWPQVRNIPKLRVVKDSWDFEKVWIAAQ